MNFYCGIVVMVLRKGLVWVWWGSGTGSGAGKVLKVNRIRCT